MLSHYGAQLGLRNARKHIGWYLEKSGRARRRGQGMAPPAVHRATTPRACCSGLAAFYDETQRGGRMSKTAAAHAHA